jgi:hypothetical protein
MAFWTRLEMRRHKDGLAFSVHRMTLTSIGYHVNDLDVSIVLYGYSMENYSEQGDEKVSPSPTEKPPRCSPGLDWHQTSSCARNVVYEDIWNLLRPSVAWRGYLCRIFSSSAVQRFFSKFSPREYTMEL